MAAVLALIGHYERPVAPLPEQEASAASVTAAADQPIARPAEIARPPEDEARFIVAVQTARGAYRAATNDMQRGAMRPARARAICAALIRLDVSDWLGKVSVLSTNNDGRGVFAVTIGPDIQLKTWNNALSDFEDHTLIDPASALYRKALNLKLGQWIALSGWLIRDSRNTDCVREASVTMDGSMMSPDFIFRFHDVAPR